MPAIVALVLCLIELTARSLWLDEAAPWRSSSQHGSTFWHAAAHDGGNMLGYYALLHVLIGWFGDGAFVIRLPSVIACGATAGAVALLGLRLFDRRVALAAGLLTAVSLPLVFWGQDARGYAAMVALVAGSFVAFAALVDGPRRRGPWIAYVALSVLSVYASYVAIFALAAQLVALAAVAGTPGAARSVHGRVRRLLDPAGGARAQPGLGPAVLDRPPDLQARAPGRRRAHVGRVRAELPPGRCRHPAGDPDGRARAHRSCAGRARAGTANGEPVLALSWLVIPVGLMLVWSFIGQPIFTPRNLLVSLPAVSLLLGWAPPSSLPPMAAWLAVGLLIALRAVALAPSYGTSPENWRAATAYVLHASRPGDCVAFYPLDGSMPFDYYAGRPVEPHVEQYVTPTVPAGCQRVWLVASHQGLPSGTAMSRAHYARYLAVRTRSRRVIPDHVTRSFGYASVIWVDLFSRLGGLGYRGLGVRPPGSARGPLTKTELPRPGRPLLPGPPRLTGHAAQISNFPLYAYPRPPRTPHPTPPLPSPQKNHPKKKKKNGRSVVPTNVNALNPTSSTPFAHSSAVHHFPCT